jgi:4-hydroxy-4-methyl-2-oxoglutarate aldolase
VSGADVYAELARIGSATVYEGAGRGEFVNADLHQIVPGSRAAGPARTVRCAQGDNLMVHAAMAALQPGEVLVLTMPEPAPFAVFGGLLATQARARGAAAVLVDASVRDVEELVELGPPTWARWVRIQGAVKETAGELDVPVQVGGATINPGDIVVLDTDGVAVIEAERVDEVIAAAREREEKERVKGEKLSGGALSYDLDGLRAKVEGAVS